MMLLEGGQGAPVLARSALDGSDLRTKVRLCCPWWEVCFSRKVVGLRGNHEPRTAGGPSPELGDSGGDVPTWHEAGANLRAWQQRGPRTGTVPWKGLAGWDGGGRGHPPAQAL